MKRPIAISLSPNTEKDDVILALKTLLTPRKWFDESEVEELEREFARKFGRNYKAIAVNSGRSAQYLILKALRIGKGDAVAIQAFTCVAVPNSIRWLQAMPIYIDINDSFNIDAKDLEKKISKKTKAVIVQHTFGLPVDLDEIKKVAQKQKATLIEDCSHSLGASYKGQLVGTLGEVSFFSFGRDKVLSSVFGGMIVTSNDNLYKKIKELRDELPSPPTFWVLQQLMHPIAFQLILPIYNLGAGKLLLVLLQKLGVLSKAVYEKEKTGSKPIYFPSKMPGGLAVLARKQLVKLNKFNSHRKKIVNLYFKTLNDLQFTLPEKIEGSIWLRFPVRCKMAEDVYYFSKSRGILLGDWYKGIITPVKDLSMVGYKEGSCRNAEKYSKEIINLPTYPSLSIDEVKKVVLLLKAWKNTE